MKVDYIIVGFGLAGLMFVEKLKKQNKSFVVFENSSQNSSKVAAGMFNPVVLKRFTAVWNGKAQIDYALPLFQNIEKRLDKSYIEYIDIYRSFKSIEEQNNWYAACDKPILLNYMTTPLLANTNSEINAPFKFGKLKNTGRLKVKELLADCKIELIRNKLIREETFNYDALLIANVLEYNDIKAEKIVFCEGFGLKDNPYFNYLPMNEAKGELITIHAPKLKMNFLLKSAIFVLPLGNDLYKVGATFNWKDKTQKPTEEGRLELINKLKTAIDTPYKIVNHVAGIRPTIKDRRPIIGTHPKYKKLAILNGLGTRGVMLAPTMAAILYNHLENNQNIEKEINCNRFNS